ncbi:Sodium-coupled monocarboxylate transporter 1 [Mactra antiquata]
MSSGPYSYETGETKRFHIADYAVFGATLAVSAGIGIFYAIKDRKKHTTDEYLLAGRSMHPIPVAMSLLSSFISAITILGTPAEVYVYSTMYWWISVAFIITALGAAHIFIPIFYNLGITSVFQYTEMRFGRPTRILACIAYLTWMLFYMAIVMYAPSLALNAVTGLNLWGSVIAVSFVCIFYTTLGGMKAVLWADTVQMVVVYAGMITIFVIGCNVLGGVENAWNIADSRGRIVIFEFDPDPRLRHSVWNVVIGGGIFWCCVFGTNQAQVQRAISVKNVTRSRVALWLNLPGMASIITLSCLVGVVMFSFYADCDPVSFGLIQKPDQLLPLYMMDLLGDMHGLPGLLLSTVFSGSLSTISSGLNAIAAVILEDFVKPMCCSKIDSNRATWLSKGFVVLFGLVSLAFAFLVSQLGTMILQLAYVLFGVLGGPLLGMFTLGMLFPWANKWGGFFGLLSALCLLMWIGVGTTITKTSVVIKPAVSTINCNWNITGQATTALPTTTLATVAAQAVQTTSVYDKYDGINRLYTVSYIWYSGIGVVTVVFVGMIVSLITGKTDPSTLNPKLICPVFDIFFPYLPESWRKKLRFGVRHGEEYPLETDTTEKRKERIASIHLNEEIRPNGKQSEINGHENVGYVSPQYHTRL